MKAVPETSEPLQRAFSRCLGMIAETSDDVAMVEGKANDGESVWAVIVVRGRVPTCEISEAVEGVVQGWADWQAINCGG